MKKAIILFALIICSLSAIGQEQSAYQLSTHVLDISLGKPAEGVIISLYKYDFDTQEWVFIDKSRTDPNGRIGEFLPAQEDNYGAYKLRFETEPHFVEQGMKSIYPYIEVVFKIEDKAHYHIPITVSANGYSTYRGS